MVGVARIELATPAMSTQSAPQFSISGIHCCGCDGEHMIIATRRKTGAVTLVTLNDEMAVAFLKAGVEVLGELGVSMLALDAFRALTVVDQLASMTDTEADFLDASELRETCRTVVAGEPATLPRLYSENDRDRAVAALRTKCGTIIAGGRREMDFGEIVDTTAQALGMRRAGS
jgi:hypothetical protein